MGIADRIAMLIGVLADSNILLCAVGAKVDAGVIPVLTFCYFCAYSAHCIWGGPTWGVAPGFILLRLQRALVAETSP